MVREGAKEEARRPQLSDIVYYGFTGNSQKGFFSSRPSNNCPRDADSPRTKSTDKLPDDRTTQRVDTDLNEKLIYEHASHVLCCIEPVQ